MAAYRRSFLSLALATLLASLGATALPGPAGSTTPTLMWAGAKRVNIMCNVAGGPGIDHLSLARQLCRDVKHQASKGSPLPVETIVLGDPAVLSGDSVTLLVHASVTHRQGDRLIALSVRAHRTSSAGAELLFGAPPRAALLSSSGTGGPELNSVIAEVLSESLPWLAHTPPAQRIDRNN